MIRSLIPLSISAAFVMDVAAAQALTVVEAQADEFEATVSLETGQSADITLSFDDASGLSTQSLGISVNALDPFDPAFLSRLPAGAPGSIGVAAGLPMLITVSPEAGFSFDGLAAVEIYTTDLHFTAGSPLRMFKAEEGGEFRDITVRNASGSYRSLGSTGKFSEFVIVTDLRSPDVVLAGKAARLDGLIAEARGVSGDVLADALASDLAVLRAAAADDRFGDAIDAADAIADQAESAGDSGLLPDTYTPGGPKNLSGQIRAEAATIRFTLTLAANGF